MYVCMYEYILYIMLVFLFINMEDKLVERLVCNSILSGYL